jgi:hypothetical protein
LYRSDRDAYTFSDADTHTDPYTYTQSPGRL